MALWSVAANAGAVPIRTGLFTHGGLQALGCAATAAAVDVAARSCGTDDVAVAACTANVAAGVVWAGEATAALRAAKGAVFAFITHTATGATGVVVATSPSAKA